MSGGFNKRRLKSVEVHDHHENKWHNISDMIDVRYNRGVVSFDNKLFVIAGNLDETYEVFDCFSRKSIIN